MPHHDSASASSSARGKRSRLVMFAVAVAFVLIASLLFGDWYSTLPEGTAATFVGRQSCVQCHAEQAKLFTGSDHDRAMDHATDDTVLADFNNAELTYLGHTSKMFRRDGKFFVNTEGPDGKLADFEVKFVFGFSPLQQYLVEFDRRADQPAHEIARLQVLRESWDTKAKRWFYLAPPDVADKLAPDDDLHWTGIGQRWNNMCADCHSTNLKRNFDVATKTYHTTFSELDVSCEACHGPGSVHVQLASAKSLFWDRKLGYGLPKLKGKENAETQIQACAPCHARRRVIQDDFQPGKNYFDHFATETLGELTYHADGQILDEVYEHGSFLQSKMYHKGIRCSDCHDPHSTKLKQTGNQVCTSCHAHPAGKYDGPAHHHHAPGSAGASCVECHMPTTTYMQVDPRRDHSLRIPRPALSVQLQTPNACTGCHLRTPEKEIRGVPKVTPELAARAELREYADWLRVGRRDTAVRDELTRFDRWAADQVAAWYPKKADELEHYAVAIQAARQRQPDAENKLLRVARDARYPALARATALGHLAALDSPESLKSAATALGDADPTVRSAAIQRFDAELSRASADAQQAQSEPEQAKPFRPIVTALTPALQDPVRLVRIEAARVLARIPKHIFSGLISGPTRRQFDEALAEFTAGQLVNNDRAGAHMAIAILHEDQQELEKAVTAYRRAIKVEPLATGPRSNLAAVLDRLAHQAEADIRRLAQSQQTAAAQELAAKLVAYQQEASELRRDELPLLARDARLAPDDAAIQYRYGLSLYLHGQMKEAEASLLKATSSQLMAPDALMALALLYEKQERWPEAIQFAERLVRLQPQNATYRQLLESFQAKKPAGPAKP